MFLFGLIDNNHILRRRAVAATALSVCLDITEGSGRL